MGTRRTRLAGLGGRLFFRANVLSEPTLRQVIESAQLGWGERAGPVRLARNEDVPPVELRSTGLKRALESARIEDDAIVSFPGRPGLALYLASSENLEYPAGNRLGIEVLEAKPEDGEALERFFRALVDRTPCLYGHAEARAEFDAQNLDHSGGGLCAIGVNLLDSLPGVYWLNAFGPPYLALKPAVDWEALGGERLRQCALVKAGSSPFDWSTRAARRARARIRDVVGRELFFDRKHPDRPLVAPAYRVPRIA